ncbi:MAG: hypothetical protein ABJB47_23210 [Actinomycetota bacterium]
MTGLAVTLATHPVVVTSRTWLWFLTRATGLVALVLLTASKAFGLLSSVRYQRPGWPRFVTAGLHRNASVLACVFTAVHIVTTLADGFVQAAGAAGPGRGARVSYWLRVNPHHLRRPRGLRRIAARADHRGPVGVSHRRARTRP